MSEEATLTEEKSDSESKPFKFSKEQENLVNRVYLLAYDVLRSLLPSAERYAVIQETADGFKFLASNDLGSDVETELSRRILKATLQDDSTLVLPDAQKDKRHRRSEVVQEKKVRSVICVPFKIPGDQNGLLYADSLNQAALFSTNDQQELEQLAERLTRNLQVISMADPETVQLPGDENVAGDNSLRNMLLAGLCLVLLIGVGSVASQSLSIAGPEVQQVSEDAPPDLTERPFGVTKRLLAFLQEEDYTQAHKLLSIERAQIVKPGEFMDLSRELRKSQEEQAPFHILSEVVAGKRATVVVGQTLQGAPDNLWTLEYELEAGDWKLAGATGSSFSERLWGKVNES